MSLDTAELYPEICDSILRCLSGCDRRIRTHSEIVTVDEQYVSVHAERCKKINLDLGREYEMRIGVESDEDGNYNAGLLEDMIDIASYAVELSSDISGNIKDFEYEGLPGVYIEYGYAQHICYYTREVDK